MGTYSLQEFQISNGLDEVGLSLGLQRLPEETLADYRRRLLFEARAPSGSDQKRFIRSLPRRVGEFDVPVFEIDPTLDGNGDPLASDPYVEITSSYLRLYDDYSSGTPEIEVNLVDTRFLRDVYTAIAASSYFDVTILDTDYTFKRSLHLMYGDTNRFYASQFLSNSRSNRLSKRWVQEIFPQIAYLFEEEVGSLSAVDAIGKYYIDYTEGVIFTHEHASGSLAFTYRDFPYKVFWQPVRVFPYRDVDKKYKYYDTLLDDDTGLPVYEHLNGHGAEIADMILDLHPLGWGE